MFHRRHHQSVLPVQRSSGMLTPHRTLLFDPVLQTAGQVVAANDKAKTAAERLRAS